jgi:AcrR family transcriptional regulator
MISGAGRGGRSAGAVRGDVAALQRARILQATVEVVAERGYARTTVGQVVARARVSRRTFERLFRGLEDCLATVFDLGLERTIVLVGEAFEREESWQDGLRMALASLLLFLEREPLLTRVWLVESLAAGPWAVEHRERNLQVVRELVLSGWPASEEWSLPPLAAEGVIASVLGILHTHIATGRPEPLIELLGPLMGLVSRPYLPRREIAREVERGAALARAIQAGEHALGPPGEQPGEIPAVLGNPNAHRARECLLFLVDHPDASNREVAAGIGVVHQSQISKLLGDLVAEGLVVKRSEGTGQRNAWRLTPQGREILRALSPR